MQSIIAIAFCAAGALIFVVTHYQMKHYQIGKVSLISLRAKHSIGLLCVIVGVLISVAQLILRR